MLRALRRCLLPLFLVSGIASATEPLHDQIEVDGQQGVLLPAKCCWVDLPKTERLLEARKAERCSAIGGPVGRFKYENGKLWLVGLYRCGAPVDLREIYPEFDDNVLAVWLNGEFTAQTGWLCRSRNGRSIYRKTLNLTVIEGRVSAATETNNDESACASDSR